MDEDSEFGFDESDRDVWEENEVAHDREYEPDYANDCIDESDDLLEIESE